MAVRISLEIGHEASLRTKKTQEGFTHDWEVFVRGCEGAEIHYYVEKVVFYLHETFQKPKRVVKEPPYSVKESGYAGFNLPIDIYLRNSSDPKKIRFNYDLNLQPAGPAIIKVQKEKYVFNSPTEDFKLKLLKGGGAIGNSSSGSSGQEVSENRSSFDEKNQMTNKPKLSGCSSDLLKKAKMKTDEPFKNFQELFGSPIITSSIKNLQEPKQQTWKDPNKSSKPEKGIDKAKSKNSPHKDSHKDKEKSKDKSSESSEKKKDKDEKKSKDKSKDRERSKDKSVKREKSPRPKSPSPTTHKRPPSPAARPPSPPPTTKHNKEAKHEKREQERKAKKEKRKHEESKSDEQREKKQKEAKISSSSSPPPPPPQKAPAPVDKPKEKEKKEKTSKDSQKEEPREKHSSKSKKRDKEKRDKKEEKHSKSDKKADGKTRQEQQVQPPPPPPPPKKEKPPPYVPPPDLIDDSSNSSSYSVSSVKPEVKPKERQKDEKSNHKSKKDKGENSIKCKRKPEAQVEEEPPSKRNAGSDTEQDDSSKTRAQEFPKEQEDDYLDVLRELQHKIMDLKNNEDLQKVVQLIATTGQYEISAHTFDFDLCLLDRATVQQLQEFFTT